MRLIVARCSVEYSGRPSARLLDDPQAARGKTDEIVQGILREGR